MNTRVQTIVMRGLDKLDKTGWRGVIIYWYTQGLSLEYIKKLTKYFRENKFYNSIDK